MRPGWNVAPVAAAALALASLVPLSGAIQAQPAGQLRPQPGSKAAPPPRAAPSYQAVAITLPESSKDPSFEAFRKELSGIAGRKDRSALARLIVSKGFFWERESGDGADPKKSGIANFAAAIGLDVPDDPDTGWDAISIYAEDSTVFGLSDRAGVVCGPADPGFNEDEFQALLDKTRTDISDWVYPISNGIELRTMARADAPVAEKLGLMFLRLATVDAPADASPAGADFLRVMLPSGKVGYVKIGDIASLGVSQICYAKEDGAWKITGVLGGVEQ